MVANMKKRDLNTYHIIDSIKYLVDNIHYISVSLK